MWVHTGLLSNGKVECSRNGGAVDVDRCDLHFIARRKGQVLEGYGFGTGRQLYFFPLGIVFILRAWMRQVEGWR